MPPPRRAADRRLGPPASKRSGPVTPSVFSFQLLKNRASAPDPPGLGSPGPATRLLDHHFPCATSRNPIDEINDCLLFFDFRLSTRCAILRPMTASPSPSPEKPNLRRRAISLVCGVVGLCCFAAGFLDRKSTRLNSSHLGIS